MVESGQCILMQGLEDRLLKVISHIMIYFQNKIPISSAARFLGEKHLQRALQTLRIWSLSSI